MISLPNATTIAQSVAASHGLDLDPDALSAAAGRLAADLALDDERQLAFDGPVPFTIERGGVVDVKPLDHVLAVVRELGSPVPAPTATPGAPTTKAGVSEVDTPIANFGRALAAQHAAAMAKEAEGWPNPWAKGQENRTRQNIIRNLNPALAARHRAEAGA